MRRGAEVISTGLALESDFKAGIVSSDSSLEHEALIHVLHVTWKHLQYPSTRAFHLRGLRSRRPVKVFEILGTSPSPYPPYLDVLALPYPTFTQAEASSAHTKPQRQSEERTAVLKAGGQHLALRNTKQMLTHSILDLRLAPSTFSRSRCTR
ncbi:hypothetical protein NMY22_g15806 [Coprinellus aureogranulatus]|nr:hypothetical protein NMY22_g15806 [Coprinellus aureogranulatus]